MARSATTKKSGTKSGTTSGAKSVKEPREAPGTTPAEEPREEPGTTSATDPSPDDKGAGLNDVMIAMDVVDTLRHDERIAKRELDDESRRADLIKRLRKIYKDQGIDVPDRILQEGVTALAEERFSYERPKDDWRRKLAELYVTRGEWGKWLLGALGGIVIALASWYFIYERPRLQNIERLQVEMTDTLPAQMTSTVSKIERETKIAAIVKSAQQIRDDGLAAAKSGNAAEARKSAKTLSDMLGELRVDYKIRIVTRKGELSGLWRIPRVNPTARNYYLIVEAVRTDGSILPRTLVNEETGKRDTVKTWALRVPKAVLDKVQLDKSDDGIIQNAIIGAKARGVLEPTWYVDVSGGALTRW